MVNQKTSFSSTQEFTQITDIIEDVIILTGGNACLVIEVSSTNFSLLSIDEQNSRIGAYASFLNSLSFPIQILLINKRVDISSYLRLLDSEITKIKEEIVLNYMQKYKEFVQQIVKQNTVLDKKFYIVISYSFLEKGAASTIVSVGKQTVDSDFFIDAKTNLNTKAETIRNQLGRINLQTKILEKEQLISIFQQAYSPDVIDSLEEKNEKGSMRQGGNL